MVEKALNPHEQYQLFPELGLDSIIRPETGVDMFDAFVLYHISTSLNPVDEEWMEAEHPEGKENHSQKGLVLIRNGDELRRKLEINKKVGEDDFHLEVPASNLDEVIEGFNVLSESDGAALYEPPNHSHPGRMTQVGKIYEKVLENALELLPANFNSYKGPEIHTKQKALANLGTRRRMAMVIPTEMPGVWGYVLSASSYGDLGLGKVLEFGPKGLYREMFFLKGDPSINAPSVHPTLNIVGIVREYAPGESGRPEITNTYAVRVLERDINKKPTKIEYMPLNLPTGEIKEAA